MLTPLPPWALITAVLAGQAMATLDTSIVNVGGPTIQRDLHLSGPALQLAIYSYVLAYAVALVIGARLGDRYGYGRLFTAGTALFTASSLACALAAGPATLVTARTAQGLGAALLVPQVLSLLQVTFTGAGRRRALGLYSAVLAGGVGAGQVLGGLLTTADVLGTGWRPIFLVNVPLGITILAISTGRLPTPHRAGTATPPPTAPLASPSHSPPLDVAGAGLPASPSHTPPLDMAGAGLLAVAVLALVTPLTFGAGTGWPLWCWPVLMLGGAALLAFRSYETRLAASGDPLVHPALLAPAEVRTGLTGIFVLMAAFGGLLFTIAVHLQHTLGHSALRSGLTFAGFSAGFATASLTWPRLPARWHPSLPAAATLAVAAATAALALTTRHGWPWPATVLLAAAGAGSGTGFGAMVQRTAAAVPPVHAGSFGGVLSMTNQLAIITGIATAGSLYLAIQPDLSWVLLAIAAVLAGTAGRRKLCGLSPVRQSELPYRETGRAA